MKNNGHDPKAIAEAIRLIVGPGQVTELRALEATTAADKYPHTAAGYFDDPDKLVAAVGAIRTAKGIYFITNPLEPALLARAANRLRKAPKGESTQDNNILRRHWLLIDADAMRPSGISATDAEHEAAIIRAREIFAFLRDQGWPDPIAADSGNGAHLLYRIDLPAEDDGLVQRCLHALAQRFDDSVVNIDQTVFNPARIWKLYGTMARKGDNTPDRPHRMARVLSRPDTIEAVPVEKLEALAAEACQAEPVGLASRPAPRAAVAGNLRPFDVEAFIAKHHLDATAPEPWNGQQGPGRRWVLNTDPMGGGHDDGSCFIIEHATGAVSAGCHHNSATWTWHDLRAKYEPERNLPMDEARPGTPVLSGPVLVWMANVKPEPVRWLWPSRIALGKLTLLVGDPKVGKSFITLDLAARVSRGDGWPDCPACTSAPGGVVLLSAEDDLGDTIRPRLDAAGADVSRIKALVAAKRFDFKAGGERQCFFDLSEDLAAMEQAILDVPDCRLVVIDPITAYLGAADSHKNAEIRGLLAPLSEIASRRRVAIVAVTHLRKGEGRAMYRAIGSIAFTAAARAVFSVSKDKDDPTGQRRLVLPVGNNLGNDTTGLAYRLDPTESAKTSAKITLAMLATLAIFPKGPRKTGLPKAPQSKVAKMLKIASRPRRRQRRQYRPLPTLTPRPPARWTC